MQYQQIVHIPHYSYCLFVRDSIMEFHKWIILQIDARQPQQPIEYQLQRCTPSICRLYRLQQRFDISIPTRIIIRHPEMTYSYG
ncbi:hypothetical protein D3C78_1729980 [compost metagenome]